MTEVSQYRPPTTESDGEAGGQDRTADSESTARVPAYARARAAGARARTSSVAVLATVAQRVDRAVSENRTEGEGARVFRVGAESPLDLVDRVKEGPAGAAEWPRWQVALWRLVMLMVGVPAAVLGHGLAWSFGRPLRAVAATILLVLLVVTLAAGGAG